MGNDDNMVNGYLEQRSVHIKKFKKRWFSINENYLFSYKTQMDEFSMKQPTEKIDLSEYEFINVDGMRFELLTADKKKKRVFIAPNNVEQIKWLKAIKAQTKLQDLHFYSQQQVDDEKADVLWNDTDKIWEYYWLSDGCNDKSIHRGFTCKQMYERNATYFVKAEEPIMYKRIVDKEWSNSDEYPLLDQLQKFNVNGVENISSLIWE